MESKMNAKLMNKNGNYLAIWKSKNYETAQNETYEFLVSKRIFEPVKLLYSKKLSCTIFLNQSLVNQLTKLS